MKPSPGRPAQSEHCASNEKGWGRAVFIGVFAAIVAFFWWLLVYSGGAAVIQG